MVFRNAFNRRVGFSTCFLLLESVHSVGIGRAPAFTSGAGFGLAGEVCHMRALSFRNCYVALVSLFCVGTLALAARLFSLPALASVSQVRCVIMLRFESWQANAPSSQRYALTHLHTGCDRHWLGISTDASKGVNLPLAGFGRAGRLRLETSHPCVS